MSGLLTPNPVYKPFRYPWAYEMWLKQQQVHWLPEEVPLADDVKDWHHKLNAGERNLLTHIFRFFTQADVEVNNCYMKHYSRVFQPTEVQMMLAAFSNMETIHIAAYSHLLDTIGIPEVEYSAFLRYKEMKDKYDYMQGFNVNNPTEIARTLAVFGAFTEGLQLFASFAILMNFPRFNKMKGMGQIVTWSVRDETLHTLSIIRLFRTFVEENKHVWTESFQRELYLACDTVVDHEDAFIDLAFELVGRGPEVATGIACGEQVEREHQDHRDAHADPEPDQQAIDRAQLKGAPDLEEIVAPHDQRRDRGDPGVLLAEGHVRLHAKHLQRHIEYLLRNVNDLLHDVA